MIDFEKTHQLVYILSPLRFVWTVPLIKSFMFVSASKPARRWLGKWSYILSYRVPGILVLSAGVAKDEITKFYFIFKICKKKFMFHIFILKAKLNKATLFFLKKVKMGIKI